MTTIVRQFFQTESDCNPYTGCIIPHPSEGHIRDGYLKCNGAYLSRYTYDLLYASIGNTYGSSGTNFRLPDLRGAFIRGWGGNANGVGTYQADTYQSHQHYFKLRTSVDQYVGTSAADAYGGAIAMYSYETAGNVETRPRNMSVIFLIRYI